MEVEDCDPAGLYTHDLGLLFGGPEILVDEAGHLGGLAAASLASDQHELIQSDGSHNVLLLAVNGQVLDRRRHSLSNP